MKHTLILLSAIALVLAAGCSGHAGRGYDNERCRELSLKIENRDSLTARDYSDMIDQNEAILQYLVEKSKAISEMPDSSRINAWRLLTADSEYLERFGYMFTLGSALYDAERSGALDSRNVDNLRALDKYNEDLATYSERF